MAYTLDKIIAVLRTKLSEGRFTHSIRVANCAVELARRFNCDEDKAYLAGVLHDCSTQYCAEDMIALAEKAGLEVGMEERDNPVSALHARLGAYVAEYEYGIDDAEILQAISYHSSGGIDMTKLDKIISLADAIEPSRKGREIDAIRILAEDNLDAAISEKCSLYIINTIRSRQYLDSQKIDTYNYLLHNR